MGSNLTAISDPSSKFVPKKNVKNLKAYHKETGWFFNSSEIILPLKIWPTLINLPKSTTSNFLNKLIFIWNNHIISKNVFTKI